MIRGVIRQFVKRESIPVYGPEPVGAAQASAIQAATVLSDVSGSGKPNLRRRAALGPTGSPSRTFAGDLGPLQGDFSKVRTVAAPNANRAGWQTALPATSTNTPGSIQDRMAALGI